MSLAKRRKKTFLFFSLLLVLCLRPLWAQLQISRKQKKEKAGNYCNK